MSDWGRNETTMAMKPSSGESGGIEPGGAQTIDNMASDLMQAIEDLERARATRAEQRRRLQEVQQEVDWAEERVAKFRGKLHESVDHLAGRALADEPVMAGRC